MACKIETIICNKRIQGFTLFLVCASVYGQKTDNCSTNIEGARNNITERKEEQITFMWSVDCNYQTQDL